MVSATGYLGNLARVDDRGDHGELIAVARVGESPKTTSLFVSSDGKSYGVAARTVQRFGEAFSLLSAGTRPEVFSSFGDAPPFQHRFSVSADATTVLAPGPYGFAAWQLKGSTWHEAWADDYWKTFDELDWPVAEDGTRIPSFDTIVPPRGDTALIAFCEFTNNNWIRNQTASSAEVSARSLSTGAVRWTFRPEIARTLVFPTLYADEDGSLVLLQAQLGSWGKASYRYYALENGHATGSWTTEDGALSVAVSDRTKRVALTYGNGSRLLEVRAADGTIVFNQTWHTQPLALVFAEDGTSLFVSDEGGLLSRLDACGNLVWQTSLGNNAELARSDAGLYAAGWDGRLRAFTPEGKERWTLDLTTQMASLQVTPNPKGLAPHEPQRPIQTSAQIPTGTNLLKTKQATLLVGGTPGFASWGQVQVAADALTNGALDDVATPWIPNEDLFWDGTTGRKVWAEIDFKTATDIHSLTVFENPKFPDSWPTESSIQFWDKDEARWRTAKHAAFLRGPVNTYSLDLKRMTKLRYVPWSNSFRNFYTSEIEVR